MDAAGWARQPMRQGHPPTAFEAYLQGKRSGNENSNKHGSVLNQVQGTGAACGSKAAEAIPPLTPNHALVQHRQPQHQQEEASSLAEAARSLAQAARSLAREKLPQGYVTDSASSIKAANVQASYDALAVAAQQLANSVTTHTSAGVRPSTGNSDQKRSAAPQLQVLQPTQQQRQQQTGLTPLQPQQAGFLQSYGLQASMPREGWSAKDVQKQSSTGSKDSLQQACEDPGRVQAGTAAPFKAQRAQPVVSAGCTSTPSFAPLSPLIALAAHSKRPGSSAATVPGPVTGAGKRPATANPITHSLDDCPGTASRSSISRQQQQPSAGVWPHLMPATPGPGDEGSSVAQVLAVSPGAPPPKPCNAGSTAGAGDVLALTSGLPREVQLNPVQLFVEAPELLRMEKWPPTTPVTVGELQDDSLSCSLNALLNQLRERIRNHGVGAMERSFRLADADGSGELNVSEFRNVLERALNLDLSHGASNSTASEQQRALDALMRGLDQNQDGCVNFVEFINALKFNQLPYQVYNRRFRHRAAGNPDQPIGPSSIRFPYGTLPDGEHNTQQAKLQLQDTFQELQRAFQAADTDADGIVSRKQFAAALRSIDAAHKLSLPDTYIQQLFRDSDPDFTGTVDYGVFLQAFHTGGPGARFVPEFMLPQSLRCSQLGPPWEWKDAPEPGARRSGALAPPLTATRKISAGLPLATPSSKAAYSTSRPLQITPPATPLGLPGTKLLRSLDA